MNLFVFIATGVVILAAPLYAAEVTDEMRQARAEAIAGKLVQCATNVAVCATELIDCIS